MSFTSYSAGVRARDERTIVLDAVPLLGADGDVSLRFHGRRREQTVARRIPPGQYVVRDFPVLCAGPTQHTPLNSRTFLDYRRSRRRKAMDVVRIPQFADRDHYA